MFARSSEQASQWLSDLSTWVVKDDPKPEDPKSTRRMAKTPGGRVPCKQGCQLTDSRRILSGGEG